jgi:thioredoxin 1
MGGIARSHAGADTATRPWAIVPPATLTYGRGSIDNVRSQRRLSIMAKAIEVTDSTFEQEVLQSTQPVLVDFWAVWCGPCRAVAPIVEEIAGDYEGKLKVMKLDVDDNPRTAVAYGVQSIPTLLVFKDGKPAERIIGAVPKKVIVDKLQSVMP